MKPVRKYGKRRSRFKVHRPSGKAKALKNRRRANNPRLAHQTLKQSARHGPRAGFYGMRGNK